MTGLALVGGNAIIGYSATGGGKTIGKTWGAGIVSLDYAAHSRLDRFGRIGIMDFQNGAGATIHKYEYGYDDNGNRAWMRSTQGERVNERDYLYGYDRLNRLVHAERGNYTTFNGGTIANGGVGRAWGLDVLGNWSVDLDPIEPGNQSVIDYTTRAAGTTERGYTPGTDDLDSFTHHATDETNQIVSRSFDDDGDGSNTAVDANYYHDEAGNLVLDGEKLYQYDAWNRVVDVKEKDTLAYDPSTGQFSGSPGDTVAKYEYDALGRRIAKTVGIGVDPTDYFYYDGHRVLEHRTGTNADFHRQYVYGLKYVDEPVAYFDSESGTATPHFILQDANYDVVAVTSDQGVLEQQYTLSPYGQYLYIEDGNGNVYNATDADLTALAISFGRNGLWFDPETGLYYNRARHYDPVDGRFRQKDSNGLGLVLSSTSLFSGESPTVSTENAPENQYSDGMAVYGYLGGNPASFADPLGLRRIHFGFYAFINGTRRGAWLTEPFSGGSRQFKTDRRDFGENGTSRIWIQGWVESNSIGNLGTIKGGDGRTWFLQADNGTSLRRNTLTRKNDAPGKGKLAFSSSLFNNPKACSSNIKATLSAAYPYRLGSPDIDIHLTLDFKVAHEGLIEVSWRVKHNAFPDYELDLDDNNGVYTYFSPSTGPSFLNLVRSEESNGGMTVYGPTKCGKSRNKPAPAKSSAAGAGMN